MDPIGAIGGPESHNRDIRWTKSAIKKNINENVIFSMLFLGSNF